MSLFRIVIILLTILTSISVSKPLYASLYINEVMPESENSEKWVEIYSQDDESFSLDNYILSTNNNLETTCGIQTSNSYVYLLSGSSDSRYFLIQDPTLSFQTDLALYLIDCSNQVVESSFFVPLMDKNYSYARNYDGAINAEERDYSLEYLNTKGVSNNVIPVLEDVSLDKGSYIPDDIPELSFSLKVNEDEYEEIRIYINGYLVKRVNEYQTDYEVSLDYHDYFFSGGNVLKLVAKSNIGSSEDIINFDYQTSESTITIDTIHNPAFSGTLNVSGVVSSNYLIEKIYLYFKSNSGNYSLYDEVDITGQEKLRYGYSFNFKPENPGDYNLKIEVEDQNYSNEREYADLITYDPNAPDVDIDIDPEDPDGDGDYFISEVEIELSSSEESKIYYRWDEDGSWIFYKDSFEALEGENTLYYKSVDNSGKESSIGKKDINVDTISPDVYITLDPELPDGLNGYYLEEPSVVFNSFFEDISKYEYSFDKRNWVEYKGDLKINDSSGTFYYRSVDNAGNKSDTKLFNLKTALEKPSVVKSIDYKVSRTGEVVISWVDYKNDETYLYEIYKSVEPDIEINKQTFYTAVPSTQNQYIDTNVVAGQTYYYLLLKKNNAGKVSDPVRFKVRIPESNVLGRTEKKSTLMYLLNGPVVKTEQSFEIDSNGDVLGTSTVSRFNIMMFLFSFSVLVFLSMKVLYKLRVQNAA